MNARLSHPPQIIVIMLLTPWGNAQAPRNQIPLLLLLTPLPTILPPTSILSPISTLHIHDFLSLIIYLFIPVLPISLLPISLLFPYFIIITFLLFSLEQRGMPTLNGYGNTHLVFHIFLTLTLFLLAGKYVVLTLRSL